MWSRRATVAALLGLCATPATSRTLYGGIRQLPLEVMPREGFGYADSTVLLEISYSQHTLRVFRRSLGAVWPLKEYAVVTPAPTYIHQTGKPFVRGRITDAIRNPRWCPTDSIRREMPDLSLDADGCVPSGHPQNAMDPLKFIIAWQVPDHVAAEWQYVRLHGTREYPADYRNRTTHGCTRLMGHAILEMYRDVLGPDAVRQRGVEIAVFP